MKLQGRSFQNNSPIEVNIFDARIESIIPVAQHTQDFFIGPGFTDIQVNGYGGVDYNELQPCRSRPALSSRSSPRTR